MSVPNFQQITLPLLQLTADGADHRLGDAIAALAAKFGLTDEQRAELLPSGKQSRFANRVGWARTYLIKSGLLQSTGVGTFRITSRGTDVLSESPTSITVAYLERFPEYREFRTATSTSPAAASPEVLGDQTPEELIAAAHKELSDGLAYELLGQVKARSPLFFEHLVVDLLVRMGYGGSRSEAATQLGRTGDGGVDGLIKEDRLGLDVVYIQAKRWEGTVGRPTVQAFAGSLEGHHARKGVLITTGSFSEDARKYVEMIEKKIVLIDGPQLVNFMIEHELGVTEVERYSLKRVALEELDYYEELPLGAD